MVQYLFAVHDEEMQKDVALFVASTAGEALCTFKDGVKVVSEEDKSKADRLVLYVLGVYDSSVPCVYTDSGYSCLSVSASDACSEDCIVSLRSRLESDLNFINRCYLIVSEGKVTKDYE